MICKRCCKNKPKYAKGLCDKCYKKIYMKQYQIKYKNKLNEYQTNRNHKLNLCQSLTENKKCNAYLGNLSESILCSLFNNTIRMSYGNKGYDFIGNGFKIDAKSSCRCKRGNTQSDRWVFDINKNKISDYFACLAFDNREDLNIEHYWLIPSNLINNKVSLSITESQLNKWNKYELDIIKLQEMI